MNYSEDELNFNGTALNVTTTTARTSSAPTCQSGLEYMRLVVDVYMVIPIAIVGIIGNILAFIVLCRHKNRLTTTIILQCLALVDTILLIAVIPTRPLYYSYLCLNFPPNYKETWKFIFRWVYPFSYMFRMVDTWLITLLTLDRWIAVCRPLHAQRLCTRSSTYKRLAILIVAAAIFSVPRFFESTQYGVFEYEQKHLSLMSFQTYNITYRIILFFIFMYLIPMILLIVLNIQLILALRMVNASFAGRRHSQSSSSAQNRGITVIVVTVVTTCVVCNILAMVSHLMLSIEFLDPTQEHNNAIEEVRRPLAIISNLMIAINSSINFALYCFSSKNFRQITFKTLGCEAIVEKIGYSKVQRNTSMMNTSLTDTYVSQRQSNGNAKEHDVQLKRLIKTPH